MNNEINIHRFKDRRSPSVYALCLRFIFVEYFDFGQYCVTIIQVSKLQSLLAGLWVCVCVLACVYVFA